MISHYYKFSGQQWTGSHLHLIDSSRYCTLKSYTSQHARSHCRPNYRNKFLLDTLINFMRPDWNKTDTLHGIWTVYEERCDD